MKVQKVLKSYIFLLLVAGTIIALDQWSKAVVRAEFTGPEGMQMWAPWDWLVPYARIVHVTNTGVAFGMFQGMWMVFAVLAGLVALAIIFYFPQVPEEDRVLRISMSMMLAGALGNLIDRLTNGGAVTDFVSVGNFPVFNVADASITIGVVILLLGMLVQEYRQKQKKETEDHMQMVLDNEVPSSDQQVE